jgi:hypothetical protein
MVVHLVPKHPGGPPAGGQQQANPAPGGGA